MTFIQFFAFIAMPVIIAVTGTILARLPIKDN